MIIYKTKNLVNGKIYIGKDAINNPKYLGSGNLIKLAIKKYGKKNFVKEILSYCSSLEELSDKECYWIKKFDSTNNKIGYNLSSGGIGGCLGCKRSEETIAKITGVNNHFYGKHHTDETKEMISDIHKGKISPNKGVIMSIDTKTKISNTKKGTEPWNKNKKNVYSDETIEKFRVGSLGNSNFLGMVHTDEAKEKIRVKAKGRYTTETHPSFINLPKDELISIIKTETIENTAKHFNVSVTCIRKRIKIYNIVDREINTKKHGLYIKIDDEILKSILLDRNNNKLSFEKLSKKYGFSVTKIKSEIKLNYE